MKMKAGTGSRFDSLRLVLAVAVMLGAPSIRSVAVDSAPRHLIYLHGRIVQEQQSARPLSPQFGYYELEKILSVFRDRRFLVSGPIRPKTASVSESADRVVEEIQRLLESGVPADHVTVVGASMGAEIALLTSARLQNPDVRFCLIGMCLSENIRALSSGNEKAPNGHLLAIREESDDLVGPCPSWRSDPNSGPTFVAREIVVSTGLSHGFIYRPLPEWVNPVVEWATTRNRAEESAWQPSPGHTQVPIWPGAIPDAQPVEAPEESGTVVDGDGNQHLVGGKPWVYVARVSQPTMTVYSPVGSNTGAAVVVFPGGGYNVLAIDLEGTEACDWLTSRGITCVLLKYRVPCEKTGPYRDCATALQDAQRTVGLVRLRAAQWHIDPHKIGVLGFSAGGHMVAALSTHFEKRLYPAVDAADNESCRPDFAVGLYPGHLAVREKDFALNPAVQVSSQTPPTFLLHAEDDPVDPVENSLVYHAALRKAGVPAEMHLFVKGGHAFGLRRAESPITRWPQLVETWLESIGIITR